MCLFFFRGRIEGERVVGTLGTLWLNRGLFLVDGGSS